MRHKPEQSNYISQREKLCRKPSQGQSLEALHRKKARQNKYTVRMLVIKINGKLYEVDGYAGDTSLQRPA